MRAKRDFTALCKTAAKYVIPLVVSVGLCRLLFTDVDLGRMWSIISRECRPAPILLGFVFAITAQLCRAVRWGIQLRALGIATPPAALVLSIFGTYAVNLVFPRLGEVWRSAYIARRQQAPFATVFGSMVADRLSDTLSVLLMTVWAFFVSRTALTGYLAANSGGVESLLHRAGSPWLWAAVAVAVAGVAALFMLKGGGVLAKLRHALRELWTGFAVVFRMRGLGWWLLLTVGIWGSYLAQTAVAFYAFGFTADLADAYGLAPVLVTFVLGSISMGVPSNGGIGPWQWAVIFGLGIFGVARPQAAAWATLVLGSTTLLTIVLGIVTFIIIAIDSKKNIIKQQ